MVLDWAKRNWYWLAGGAHRIYGVPESRGNWVRFILLRGWVKDKAGKGVEESNQITAAQNVFKEYAARRAACTERG